MKTMPRAVRALVLMLLMDLLFTLYRVSTEGRWIGLYATGLSLDWRITGGWLGLKGILLYFIGKGKGSFWGYTLLSFELIMGASLSAYDVWLFVLEPCACTPVPHAAWFRMAWNIGVVSLWGYRLGWGGFIRRPP